MIISCLFFIFGGIFCVVFYLFGLKFNSCNAYNGKKVLAQKVGF